MGRQANGWTKRTDFMELLLQRWKFDFVLQKFENKSFRLIVSYIKRINARKRNTINIVWGSKSSKTMIFSKIT